MSLDEPIRCQCFDIFFVENHPTSGLLTRLCVLSWNILTLKKRHTSPVVFYSHSDVGCWSLAYVSSQSWMSVFINRSLASPRGLLCVRGPKLFLRDNPTTDRHPIAMGPFEDKWKLPTASPSCSYKPRPRISEMQTPFGIYCRHIFFISDPDSITYCKKQWFKYCCVFGKYTFTCIIK